MFDARLGDRVRFPKHVEILNGDGRGGQQLLAPSEIGFGQLHGRLPAIESRHGGVQVGDLVVHVLDGMLEFETIGSGLGHLAADQGLGSRQVRLSRFQGGFLDGYLNPVRLRVEFHQHVPLFHAVVVVHQDVAHLARHAGSNESDVPVDIGVIGGNRVQSRDHPRDKEVSGDRQGNRSRRQQQWLSPSAQCGSGSGRFRCDLGRRAGRGDLVLVRVMSRRSRCGGRTALRFRFRGLGSRVSLLFVQQCRSRSRACLFFRFKMLTIGGYHVGGFSLLRWTSNE